MRFRRLNHPRKLGKRRDPAARTWSVMYAILAGAAQSPIVGTQQSDMIKEEATGIVCGVACGPDY